MSSFRRFAAKHKLDHLYSDKLPIKKADENFPPPEWVEEFEREYTALRTSPHDSGNPYTYIFPDDFTEDEAKDVIEMHKEGYSPLETAESICDGQASISPYDRWCDHVVWNINQYSMPAGMKVPNTVPPYDLEKKLQTMFANGMNASQAAQQLAAQFLGLV